MVGFATDVNYQLSVFWSEVRGRRGLRGTMGDAGVAHPAKAQVKSNRPKTRILHLLWFLLSATYIDRFSPLVTDNINKETIYKYRAYFLTKHSLFVIRIEEELNRQLTKMSKAHTSLISSDLECFFIPPFCFDSSYFVTG